MGQGKSESGHHLVSIVSFSSSRLVGLIPVMWATIPVMWATPGMVATDQLPIEPVLA